MKFDKNCDLNVMKNIFKKAGIECDYHPVIGTEDYALELLKKKSGEVLDIELFFDYKGKFFGITNWRK